MGPYINCLQEFYRYFIGKSGLRISNLWGLHVTYNPSKNQLQSEKREKVCFSNLSFLKGCQHCIGGIYCLFWWLSQNCKFNYDLSTFLAFLSQKSRLSGWVPLRIFRLQATAVDRYLPALQSIHITTVSSWHLLCILLTSLCAMWAEQLEKYTWFLSKGRK